MYLTRRARALFSAVGFIVVTMLMMIPDDAEAIPAFSRQTGESCSRCHFLTFPALNRIGREFKRSAYTTLEGEPATKTDDVITFPVFMNASFVVNSKFTHTKVSGTNPSSTSTYTIPLEPAPLLIAGRVGNHIGLITALGGPGEGGGAAGTFTSNWKLLSSFEVGENDLRVGFNLFNTAYGWTAGLENSNVFGQHGGVLNGSNITALFNIGMMKLNMEGGTLWGGNDFWTVGLTAVLPKGFTVDTSNIGPHPIPGMRVAIHPEINGWETMLGAGLLKGTAKMYNTGVQKTASADMWFLDGQLEGEFDELGVGVYADYAHTKARPGVTYNIFGAEPLEWINNAYAGGNAEAGDQTDGWSVRVMVKPVEHIIVGGGFGRTVARRVAAADDALSVWNLGVIYEIYQNSEIKLIYGEQKMGPNYPTNATNAARKTRSTTIQYEVLM
ncbi:MAG TPA: hypothetical protein VJ961_03500 [Mariprofundaceae bacterium]|nr:hypothetical protein [Mariprofundaceae bacterium]